MAKKKLGRVERTIPVFVDRHRSRTAQGGRFVTNKPKTTKRRRR